MTFSSLTEQGGHNVEKHIPHQGPNCKGDEEEFVSVIVYTQEKNPTNPHILEHEKDYATKGHKRYDAHGTEAGQPN